MTQALGEVAVPAYVTDRECRIRWLNRAALGVLGNLIGQPFTRAVAPEDLHLARTHFAKKLIGESASTEYKLTLLGPDGGRFFVHVSSVPLQKNGEIIGVFSIACPDAALGDYGLPARPAAAAPELTARQYEALALLAEGLRTAEIARRLGVAEETARNHIRGVLRALEVHSRLEAVVRAFRLGLLRPRTDD